LKRIESEEKTDRAQVVRRLLAEAISDWKLRRALEMMRARKASVRTAAKFAGIPYIELLEHVEREAIPLDYSLSDLRNDLDALKRLK
jgi:predicted HTH domain antitoxin